MHVPHSDARQSDLLSYMHGLCRTPLPLFSLIAETDVSAKVCMAETVSIG